MLVFHALFAVFRGYFRSRRELVWENAVLRYQIGILKRKRRRLVFRRWDRPVLIWLTRHIPNWKKALHIVQPETLIRWHRKGFALYWGWKFSRKAGRPELPQHIIKLIREIGGSNPLWGAPRIHGELLKLGIKVSQASVEKYMGPRTKRPFTHNWKAFLRNHTKDVIAIDFFIVPTIKFQMLWVLVILSHDRRRILRFAVTRKPSPSWTAQQLRTAFPFESIPKTVLHDRDRNFWGLSKFGFREIITAHRCPWQNAYVERVIGSIRRECTDHVIAISERQVMRVLECYRDYYNRTRTHLSLSKDSPEPRPIESVGAITRYPRVGGLHCEFRRRSA